MRWISRWATILSSSVTYAQDSTAPRGGSGHPTNVFWQPDQGRMSLRLHFHSFQLALIEEEVLMSVQNGNANRSGSAGGGALAGDGHARCHWLLWSLSITLVSFFLERGANRVV